MEKPYTHTTWRVRAGSEDEFVRRWSEWVDWSHREGLEAPALLLRDLENPQAFISFGPWANMAAVRNGVPSPAIRNGWHGSARYSTASSHERSRSSPGARHRGHRQPNRGATHRHRETSKPGRQVTTLGLVAFRQNATAAHFAREHGVPPDWISEPAL